jgi:ethanolamine kinase
MQHLSRLSLCPPLYARFCNGFVYGYASGTPFEVKDMSETHKSSLVAKRLAEFHVIDFPGKRDAKFFDTIHVWLQHVPKTYTDPAIQAKFENFLDMQWIKQQVNP